MLSDDLLRRSSRSSPLGILFSLKGIPVSGVLGRLINLPVTGGIQGLFSSSFKDKKFNPGVFSEIPKVFQGDVSLSGILLISSISAGLGIDVNAQLLALVNFGIPIGS